MPPNVAAGSLKADLRTLPRPEARASKHQRGAPPDELALGAGELPVLELLLLFACREALEELLAA